MAQWKVTDVRSVYTEGKEAPWKVEAAAVVEEHESLNSLYFLDQTHGWAAGARALYRTDGQGKAWERIKTSLPEQARISDFFFVNPSTGWVMAHLCAPDKWCGEDHLWLMHTRDGGDTWQLQYESDDAEPSHISFVDEQHGWLVGTKNRRTHMVPLILHTSDQGQHWTDVSEGIALLLGTDNDGAAGFVYESPSSVRVMTASAKIFKTVDDRQNWQQAGAFPDELQQAGIRRFDIKESKQLIARGALGDEGVWGELTVEKDHNSWLRHKLSGVYFSDGLFLSENQVFVCGSIPQSRDTRVRHGGGAGGVLYSSDGGQNWAIIYRNPQVGRINKLAMSDPNNIWAVGEEGLALHIRPS